MSKSYHRLSAIFFSDIVGYTSMMGENEERTLTLLELNKRIHLEAFERFNSTFSKQIGDAFLGVFDSVLQAVFAASLIQEECLKNDIPLRIGIHQGEVIFKDNDVFGDDVNIASRIQSSAQSGSVYISETVKRNVENKTGIEVSLIGESTLKNVKEPVKLYALKVESSIVPKTRYRNRMFPIKFLGKKRISVIISILGIAVLFYLLFQNGAFNRIMGANSPPVINLTEKSIAILPFKNFSNDTTLNYIGDGFADHIIINLSRVPDFTVIARSSSFQFKKSDKSIQEISGILGVQNVLEGSFQINLEEVHLNLNLIHGPSGEVLHSKSYQGPFSEIFELQDEVAENITGMLVGSFLKFRPSERKDKGINLRAFRFYERGQSLLKENYVSRQTLAESKSQFYLAIREDPDWSAPYTGLAESYLMELHYGYSTFPIIEDSLKYFIEAASALNSEQGILYSLKGDMAFWAFNFKKAFELYQKAIELNPNYPNSHYYQGVIYINSNFFDEGLMKIDKAISLDPLNERYRTMKPQFLLKAGRPEEAISLCQRMLEEGADNNTTLFMLGMIYTELKDYEKAKETLLKRNVGHSTNWLLGYNYAMTGQEAKARNILDNMLQRTPPPSMYAILYLGLGDYDKALTYMDSAINTNDMWFTWFDYSWSDPVRDDPRFMKIINSTKINLD